MKSTWCHIVVFQYYSFVIAYKVVTPNGILTSYLAVSAPRFEMQANLASSHSLYPIQPISHPFWIKIGRLFCSQL